MDDKKAGLQATDGTPAGSLEDPDERPDQAGILGGTAPHTDERPSDPVPDREFQAGLANRQRVLSGAPGPPTPNLAARCCPDKGDSCTELLAAPEI